MMISGGRLAVLVGLLVGLVACGVAWWWARRNQHSTTEWVAAIASLSSVVSVCVLLAQLWFDGEPESRQGEDGTTTQASGRSRAPDEVSSLPSRPSSVASAEPITTPETTTPAAAGSGAAAYRVEYEDVPFAINHPGNRCSDYIAVDFDGDPFGNGSSITQRVVDEDELSSSEREAIEMSYQTCGGRATLSVEQGATVGLLSKTEAGAEVTPERCAAAASGASIGGALRIDKSAHPEEVGFEEGASMCAVTPEGRVAKAMITKIHYDENGYALVRFTLTTWVRGS